MNISNRRSPSTKTPLLVIVKTNRRADNVVASFSAGLLLCLIIVACGRLTIIGQVLDEVVFQLGFGVLKYLVYGIGIVTSFLIWTKHKIIISKKFFWIVLCCLWTGCFNASAIVLVINHTHRHHLPIWSPKSFPLIMKYFWSAWLDQSVFHCQHPSFLRFNGVWFSYQTMGGLGGELLSALTSYCSLFGPIVIANLILITLLIVAIIKGCHLLKQNSQPYLPSQTNHLPITNNDTNKQQRTRVPSYVFIWDKQTIKKRHLKTERQQGQQVKTWFQNGFNQQKQQHEHDSSRVQAPPRAHVLRSPSISKTPEKLQQHFNGKIKNNPNASNSNQVHTIELPASKPSLNHQSSSNEQNHHEQAQIKIQKI